MVPPVVLQGRKYFSAACCMQFSVLCHLVGLGFVFFICFFFVCSFSTRCLPILWQQISRRNRKWKKNCNLGSVSTLVLVSIRLYKNQLRELLQLRNSKSNLKTVQISSLNLLSFTLHVLSYRGPPAQGQKPVPLVYLFGVCLILVFSLCTHHSIRGTTFLSL